MPQVPKVADDVTLNAILMANLKTKEQALADLRAINDNLEQQGIYVNVPEGVYPPEPIPAEHPPAGYRESRVPSPKPVPIKSDRIDDLAPGLSLTWWQAWALVWIGVDMLMLGGVCHFVLHWL